jgi:hypothetical protein
MTTVYVLHHVVREFEDDEDAKLIGVYSTEDEARSAIARLADQPGFSDYPDGFQIDAYPVNKDHWIEGFVTMVTGAAE